MTAELGKKYWTLSVNPTPGPPYPLHTYTLLYLSSKTSVPCPLQSQHGPLAFHSEPLCAGTSFLNWDELWPQEEEGVSRVNLRYFKILKTHKSFKFYKKKNLHLYNV